MGSSWCLLEGCHIDFGPVHMRTDHVPKGVLERDSALFWFTQSCFKSGFWNAFWNAEKRAFWIVIRVESLILGHVHTKLFRNVICACAFGKCALKPRWSHAWVNQRRLRSRNKILPRSAQILIVIGKAFAMHVNTRSSNHDPNHVLDCDPKRLSECDSFSCEHSLCYIHVVTLIVKDSSMTSQWFKSILTIA